VCVWCKCGVCGSVRPVVAPSQKKTAKFTASELHNRGSLELSPGKGRATKSTVQQKVQFEGKATLITSGG
jgi:hypothetical protein